MMGKIIQMFQTTKQYPILPKLYRHVLKGNHSIHINTYQYHKNFPLIYQTNILPPLVN